MLKEHLRFESRDVCDEVIKTFNNTPITKVDGQEHLIQIRFADTQEQKTLKHQTTQARDWRTQEYELQTTGRSASAASFNRIPVPMQAGEHDFEAYMTSTTGCVILLIDQNTANPLKGRKHLLTTNIPTLPLDVSRASASMPSTTTSALKSARPRSTSTCRPP